jgi:16S rRNA (guanine527-N7)-methyltransferase
METPQLLATHFPELEGETLSQLLRYESALLEWNQKVNLVSRKDTAQALPLHLLHCLAFTRVIEPPVNGTHFVDVGSGGGLPGLVLAIVWPQAQFTLVDSVQKKMGAVAEMASLLGLANVATHWGRAEELKTKADYCIGRAVTRVGQFQQWVRHLLRCPGQNPLPNGILYLTGEDQLEEAQGLATFRQGYALHSYVPHPYLIGKYLLYLSTCNNR